MQALEDLAEAGQVTYSGGRHWWRYVLGDTALKGQSDGGIVLRHVSFRQRGATPL